jgi:hypothetical protein
MTKPICKCIELGNKALEAQNCCIATVMCFDFETRQAHLSMTIPLRKLDSNKKTKLPTLFPTFCPICGKRLETSKKSKKVR